MYSGKDYQVLQETLSKLICVSMCVSESMALHLVEAFGDLPTQ